VVPAGDRYGLIVVLATCMGAQNATARRLAVPDLTTTVLTLTITGIAADSALVGGTGSRAGRRLVSVTAMLVGALVGALFVMHAQIVYPLVIAWPPSRSSPRPPNCSYAPIPSGPAVNAPPHRPPCIEALSGIANSL
jgi:Protein of unknown function (DUF1275)